MFFNSFEFIFIFLPIVITLFFTFGKLGYRKAAIATLVIASLSFYSYWNIRYLPLLIGSILFNFAMGRAIEKSRAKKLIVIGIAANLALLGYFKYTNFFLASVNAAAGASIHFPTIILPLGISFFTFTQIAYLVDAHRGETSGYSFLEYSLFVSIFPHLIAGPILYHKNIIPQFSDPKIFRFSYASMSKGIVLFSIGLFKKVVIADNLAPLANFAFAHPANMTFIDAWQGTLAYTLQLFFDFSAYSEMAIGLGLMLNLNLPVNFNSPYKSKSIIEFWRRWHITLSNFLRSYLYIPLGGNRKGKFRKYVNLFVTMLLGGLWHGAGWTFVFWGALHGIYLVINNLWRDAGLKLKYGASLASWLLTIFCVVIAWVFFRSSSFADALFMLKAMFGMNGIVLPMQLSSILHISGNGTISFGVLRYGIQGIGLVGAVSALCMLPSPMQIIEKLKPNYLWIFATCFLFLASLFSLHKVPEFLYFQF
jgi:alginate O-acetyltransferase complex protein AlgI